MMKRFSTVALLVGVASLAACNKTPPVEETPPPPQQPATSSGPTSTGSTAPREGTQAHFEQAVNGQNVIYFDTDMYDIDSDDASRLESQASYLRQYPNIRVSVEGHTDERGTREYNLALGERRADAAKNYLVGLGIAESRINTVSYGKERPVAMGSDASSWAQNRRAVSIVVN